jgi:hypothetical protein
MEFESFHEYKTIRSLRTVSKHFTLSAPQKSKPSDFFPLRDCSFVANQQKINAIIKAKTLN